jgi:AcrR family transcriptional regulator
MTKKSTAIMRKPPLQVRARATVEAILQATARILTKEGYDALTTNRVAETAGVSIGSLYQYFPNKEALIAALSKRHMDDLEATLESAEAMVGQTSFAEIVRALIGANVAAHLIDPLLHSALSDPLPPQGDQDWRLAFEARGKTRVRALLEAHAAEIAIKDLDLATYLIMRSVEACVHDGYRHRREDMISGKLAEEISALVLNYLTIPRRTRSPRDTRRRQAAA